MAESIKIQLKDKKKQRDLIFYLMMMDKYKEAMIKTIIEEDSQKDALDCWKTLNDDEKEEWIEKIAIPKFPQEELQKSLYAQTIILRLKKEGRMILTGVFKSEIKIDGSS